MDKREWELVISKVQALKHTTDTAETIYEEANLELINTLLQLAREALPYYIDELIKARVELAAQGKLWESVKDTLVTRIDHLEKERDKTHAEEAAIVRKVKEVYKAAERAVPNVDWAEVSWDLYKAALSSTAGQDILDRLEKAELEAGAFERRWCRAEQREKQLVEIGRRVLNTLRASMEDCRERDKYAAYKETADEFASILQQTEREGAE
jgi:hypothetical protein